MVPGQKQTPSEAEAYVIRGDLSPREALWIWFSTVVGFSAIALLGPVLIPWWHGKRFSMNVSFGQGELLGFCFALFAASINRWMSHESHGNTGLKSFSIVG